MSSSSPSPVRILHVDDDPNAADLTADVLERENDRFRVETATGAREGLERLTDGRYHCVVSDYDMPGRDGLEFLEAVREDHPDLPFIIYTGGTDEELAREALAADVTAYLRKEGSGTQYAILAAHVENAVEMYRTRRALRRERAHRSALFEDSPDPVMEIVFDDETPVVDDVNPAFEDVFGFDATDITGRPVVDVVVPDGERDTYDRIRGRVVRGERVEMDVTRATATGTREFHLRVIPFGEGDSVDGAYARYTDITDRKERTRELERNERIIREMNDGVVVVQDGRITYTNPQVSELTGYAPSELRDERMGTFIAPENRETVRSRYRERIAGGRPPSTYEITVLTKDGTRVPVEITVAQVEFDEQPATVSIVRDVRARKERERKLEAAQRRFDAVFNNPVAFMALLDPDGTVREINDTALEFVDRSADDVVGEPFPETPWWNHSESLQDDLRSWIERASTGEVVRFEAEHYTPAGERTTIDGVLHPIRHDGDVVSVLAAGRDIGERKQREHELEAKNERLDEFASIVSHDLRNPLNVAHGRLELVAAECDSDHLDDAIRAHERMMALIDDLLALARAGDSLTDVEPVDLGTTVDGCWRNVETGEASLVVEADSTIRADERRLQQLLENLVRNAVEHAGPAVTVTVGGLDDGRGFYVADDGTGVPDDERDRVFDAGYSTDPEGTGFGLGIVAEIVDAHGWEIRVTDASDGGARFEIDDVEVVE